MQNKIKTVHFEIDENGKFYFNEESIHRIGRLAEHLLVNAGVITDDKEITLHLPVDGSVTVTSLIGESADDYNDIGRDHVHPIDNPGAVVEQTAETIRLRLPAHSVNIIRIL